MTETINQSEIYYDLAGEGSRRVLLLHGWGCDHSLMKPVADSLKNDFRILMPDFPGHGQSPEPPEPWGVSDYAGQIFELMHQLDFVPSAVIAHSFGCRVAAMLAAVHPDLFSKIVFTGAAGIRPKASAGSEERQSRYKSLKKAAGFVQHLPGLHSLGDRLQENLVQKYGSRDYAALSPEMRKTFVKIVNEDLTPLYPQIRQSTLLLWGDEDRETPVWMGEKMKELIPDAGLVFLEGGTHFAYLEQIQRFNTIVKHFLTEA